MSYTLSFFLLLFSLFEWGCDPKAPCELSRRPLHVNICEEPSKLDPRILTLSCHDSLIAALFEGLMRENGKGEIEYGAAESVSISEDGTIYTFHLKNTQWNNGDPLTAQDFVRTWQDHLRPTNPSPRAFLLDPILNAKQAKKGEVPLSEIGLRAIDELTLEIILEQPFSPFLRLVSSPFLGPIHHENEEKWPDWAQEPQNFRCNGPYQLAKWEKGKSLFFIQNPRYGDPLEIPEVAASFVAHSNTSIHLFTSESLDLLTSETSPVPSAYIHLLKEKDLLKTYPIAATKYISFNVQQLPFSNVHLRKAFALAIDPSDLVKHLLELNEEPASGFVPSILKKGKKLIIQQDFMSAPEHLEKGLAELGWTKEKLEEIPFIFGTASELSQKIAENLQQCWKQVLGLHVPLHPKDTKTLYTEAANRTYSFALMGRTADYLDPLAMLGIFCDANEIPNRPGWSNPEFKELLELSSSEQSTEKRFFLLEKAEAILAEELPLFPLYYQTGYIVHRPHIKECPINAVGLARFDEIRLK